MRKAWQGWKAAVHFVSKVLAWIAGLSILMIILVLLREAFGRYLFNSPTTFAYSVAGVTSIVVLYFGIAYTAGRDGHVASDLIFEHLPPRGKRVVSIVGDIIATTIGALIAYYMARQAGHSLRTGAVIQDLFDMPQAYLQLVIVVGSGLFALVAATKALDHIANFNELPIGKEPANE